MKLPGLVRDRHAGRQVQPRLGDPQARRPDALPGPRDQGTRDFLKLRTSEADKVRCGQKHFEALGVPFAVAVTADEV